MDENDRQRPGIWSEISRAVLLANLLITVLAVGAHAAVMKLTGADEVVQFSQVLGRTAPLAIVVAAITFFALWQLCRDEFNIGIFLVAGAGALFLATWTANRFGDLRVTQPLPVGDANSGWGLGSAVNYSLGMLLAYCRAYGPRDFWSSLVVGCALGWIWNRIVERTTARSDETAAEVRPSQSTRRAA